MTLLASIKRAYGSWWYLLIAWAIAGLLNAGLDNVIPLYELMKRSFWVYIPIVALLSGIGSGFCASVAGSSEYTEVGTRARALVGGTALAWATAIAVAVVIAPISYLWRLLWPLPGTVPSLAGTALVLLLLALWMSLLFSPAAAASLRSNPWIASLASTKLVWSRVGIGVLVAVFIVGIATQLIRLTFQEVLPPDMSEVAGQVTGYVVGGAINLLVGAVVFLNLRDRSH